MAYNYENLPVVSKVKIGEGTYFLKDADVRKILDTFGTAVTFNTETAVTNSANLPTSAAIITYIQQEVAGLAGAMHFKGVVNQLPEPADSQNGDVVIVGTAEYVFSGKTADAEGNWVLFGDEGVYLTIAGAETKYVQKTLTIAGIDLSAPISADALKTALDLGALAYKDSASATVTDYVTGIDGSKYTPKGSIALAEAEDGTEITGTVSTPTATVTPTTSSIRLVTNIGTAPSVNETKSGFATAGVLIAVDAGDKEMLVISDATKADALTSTGFSAGTLPVLGEAQDVLTNISVAVSTPTFQGAKIKAAFTGTEETITPTVKTGSKTITVE